VSFNVLDRTGLIHSLLPLFNRNKQRKTTVGHPRPTHRAHVYRDTQSDKQKHRRTERQAGEGTTRKPPKAASTF